MDNTSLRSIIRSLELRNIHNMSAHARRRHKTAIGIPLQRPSVERRALGLLAPPVLSSSAGAVEGSVQVSAHHLRVVDEIAIDHGALRPGDAAVGDEDVEAAVEFGDDVIDGYYDGICGGGVYLVGFAC